jgi:hypothetical protein
MNDKLSLIREKCIAANPEIVALTFGCEIGITAYDEFYSGVPLVIGSTAICKKHKRYKEECYAEEDGCSTTDGAVIRWGNEEDGWGTMTRKESEFKVLGRPIRLADVLLAILKQDPANRTKLLLESSGQFRQVFPNRLGPYWNLRADDLEKQSEETISFLYELLK